MTAPALRRAVHRDEVLALATPHEPATTAMVGVLLEGPARRPAAWVVDGPDGPIGALVAYRPPFDRRWALPLVLDPAAAPLLARQVAHTGAWAVAGVPAHVDPLVPHLEEVREVEEMPFFAVADMAGLVRQAGIEVDPRTRVADHADLDALVELYLEYELNPVATRPRLRRMLRHDLAHRPLVVLEEEGRLVGAARAAARTRRYLQWTGLTVLPHQRRRGVGMAILTHQAVLCAGYGLGYTGVRAPSNHMVFDEDLWAVVTAFADEGTWTHVLLPPPVRVRGEARVRRLVEGVEGRLRPRALDPH